ncbi:MAG: hypothetical protein H6739_27520 [Alphaproteobacteria bacterium]|nr:hypothetical protein [Alphaproteobacteria bacterium]
MSLRSKALFGLMLPLIAITAVPGCAPEDDALLPAASSTGEALPPDLVEDETGALVSTLALNDAAEVRSAEYMIHTTGGRTFRATVTQRLKRDGATETITVEDVDTRETASWVFDEDGARQIAADGSVAEITEGEDELSVGLADGSDLVLDYADVVEDSDEEAELDAYAALAILDVAPIDQDQLDALATAASAAEDDLGASTLRRRGRFLRWLRQVICNPVTTRICGLALGGGIYYGNVPVAAGGAVCIVVQQIVCR